MAERVVFQQWRKEHDTTKYPFSSVATLRTGSNQFLPEGTFLDAAMYPIGESTGLFITQVVIDFHKVTIYVGTLASPKLASGSFTLIGPPDQVLFFDAYGRPAGVLVSDGRRLGVFQSWGVGTHTFQQTDSQFCGSCVFPTPEVGVRGIVLETGELFVGNVWLVGSDGVVFRLEDMMIPVSGTNTVRRVRAIRMDVVGDPLFRRRLCTPNNLFETPSFLKQIKVIGPNMEFICSPDAHGNINLVTSNDLAADTVLRVTTTPAGIEISAAGTVTGNF